MSQKSEEKVSEEGTIVLNNLFSYSEFGFNTKSSSSSKNMKSREDFIQLCIMKLRECAKSDQVIGVARILKLISKYINLFNEDYEKMIVFEEDQEKVFYYYHIIF
jgi:hypothetical protein